MKKALQILLLTSGVICVASACVLGGIYISKAVRRLKYTYQAFSNCFRPIDYVVEDYDI